VYAPELAVPGVGLGVGGGRLSALISPQTSWWRM